MIKKMFTLSLSVVIAVTALMGLTFCTKEVPLSNQDLTIQFPVPLFSTQNGPDKNEWLSWMIREESYFNKKLPNKGWKKIDQLGSILYYSDGQRSVKIFRTKTSFFSYELSFDVLKDNIDP